MTSLQLNTELYKQLSIIAEDERLMHEVLSFVTRLAKKKSKEKESEYISGGEILAGIREGLIDVKEARKSTKPQKTLQEVIDEL